MRHALMTTHATAVCPFHPEVTVRVETMRPRPTRSIALRNLVKATAPAGIMTCWCRKSRANSTAAADRVCPHCQGEFLLDLGMADSVGRWFGDG